MTKSPKTIDEVPHHIRLLLQRELLAEMPEKRPVDWRNIETPELIAKQSEASGFNEARAACIRAITRYFSTGDKVDETPSI